MSADPVTVSHSHAAPGTDRREQEWQLAAADLAVVRRWLADHEQTDGVVIEPRPAQEIHDRYFDTEDWRMHRAGYVLRVRDASGKREATLKELASAQAEVADRREITEPLFHDTAVRLFAADGQVGTRVHAIAGSSPLHELFHVRTSRQRFAVKGGPANAELGEISLDETSFARADGAPSGSLSRVEVEASGKPAKPLERLVKSLRSECALEPAAESKFTAGAKSAGLTLPPTEEPPPPAVAPTMRMDQAAYASLRARMEAWLAHEPGARLGEDPEELHDLRVATRRMDAVLKLYQDFLPARLVKMRSFLKDLLEIFGPVRDLDVQLGDLRRFAVELGEDDRSAIQPLLRELEKERAAARTRMLTALDSKKLQERMARLKSLLAVDRTPRNRAQRVPAVTGAPELLKRRYRKFRKAADALTEQSSPAEYHRVRGQGKKLRYAIESVCDLYGKPAAELLRALRRVQNRLGEHHDAHVAAERLHSLAKGKMGKQPPATSYLMGRLGERHMMRAARARSRFVKTYRKVRRGRWKALRRKFDALATQGATPVATAASGTPSS
jgi:CHAD domain-containing protein